jgi:vacuolar-type H+-ATPase subunit H
VALVAAVVIWLVASFQRRSPGEEAEQIVAEARARAETIVSAAEAKADQIAAAATRSAEEGASAERPSEQITRDAEQAAREIVKEAEEREWELVAAAELQRTLAKREAVRAQKLADGIRRELAEMVTGLLADVDRALAVPTTNGNAPVLGESGTTTARHE